MEKRNVVSGHMAVSFRLNLADSCPELHVTESTDSRCTHDHDGSPLADSVDLEEVGGELMDLEHMPPPARPPAEGTSVYQHRAEDEAGDSLQHRGPGHKGADVVPAAIPSAAQGPGAGGRGRGGGAERHTQSVP